MSNNISPWLLSILEDIKVDLKDKLLKWGCIIDQLSMDEVERQEWGENFKMAIGELLQDLVTEVEISKTTLIDNIEELLEKSSKLYAELGTKMDLHGEQNLGLYHEEKVLRNKVNELENLIKERQNEIDALKNRHITVCEKLGKSANLINHSPLPSYDELSGYIKQIESFEQEYNKRKIVFTNIRAELIKLVQDLQTSPSLDFERMVLSVDEDNFPVTDANMKKLKDFHESMVQQMEYVVSEIFNLREKVLPLWEKLAEDQKYCSDFIKRYDKDSYPTLDVWKAELKRCEALKKVNLKAFISKSQEEIKKMWELLRLCEEQRNFELMTDTLWSEDLLSLHEYELQKLKTMYSNNKEIYDLVDKREALWTKLIELEERATAPDRYQNRGGQLLKEEKERNAISKRLPQIEEKLLELAAASELKTGNQFLIWGETVQMLITKWHDKYEEDKKLKLSARKQKRDLTLRKTPMNSRYLTPKMSVTKNKPNSLLKSAPAAVSTRSIAKTKLRFSTERKKRENKMRRLSRQLAININSKKTSNKLKPDESSSQYKLFESELSTKESCRSTLFAPPPPIEICTPCGSKSKAIFE